MSHNARPIVKITLEDAEHKTEIDRIGLQIRKNSTAFSDNATGSIPQIDTIIKTTDGKIYKATQNLNSTYTDYNGNKTTTTNAAEPIGASMCEKFVKEYEWRNQENTNNAQAKVVYGNGIYLSSTVGNIGDLIPVSPSETRPWSDYRNIYYSKNGKKWNQILLDNAIKTEISNINEYMISDICYGNGKFIVTIITDEYHLLFGYSTNAINWTITQFNGLSNNYAIAAIKICYGNNKYSGLATITTNEESFDYYSIYSTDGINWNSNIVKTNVGTERYLDLVRDICYGNNKFISVVSIFDKKDEAAESREYPYDLNDNLYYSTDGINWTSTVALSTFEHLRRIFYINNKFYLCSNMNYAYSTNGINWTKYTPKWSDGTVMDDNSFLSTQIMCKYDNNSLLGLFIDHSKNVIQESNELLTGYNELLTGYVVCKSSDGITWDKIYDIDLYITDIEKEEEKIKGLHPSNMIYVNDNICIVSNSAFMPYLYTRWVHYYWTVNKKDNNELSHIITDQPSFIFCDVVPHAALNQVEEIFGTIDTTQFENFTEGDLDEHPTGAYRFSGWSQSNITFTKDTPRVTEITGTWNWVDMVKYSYSWNAPSYSDLTGLVTLPTGGSTYAGETVSVDTKYNSDSKVEVLIWTQSTMPSNSKWQSVCYGNGKFVAVGGTSNIFAYSTDGINWTEGTMPSKHKWDSVCYGNGKFVVVSYDSSKISAYSTDGINWTEGTMPSYQLWTSVCYGNGKFVAIVYNSNVFAYSTDGINWTQSTMPSTQLWCSVCYGNGKFVVISRDSNVFAYSTNGISWTEGTMPSSQTWISVCYGNGKFVAVSGSPNSSNIFAYSTNGISWTEGTMPSSKRWSSVCYGNGKFVAVVSGANVFAYSTDGITWTKGTIPSQLWTSVCYGNSKFVVISWDYNKFAYLTLPTSYYQFSGWNPSTDFIINENKTISGTWSKKNKLRVSYSWSNQPSGMKSKLPSDEYYHSGDNVTIDTTYNNKSGYKEEKINATEGIMPSTQYWTSICYGNDKFVTIVVNSNVFAYSTDGINWTQETLPTIKNWTSVCYGSGKFVAVSRSTNTFVYSTDGINWTLGTMPSTQNWDSVCYGNGRFVAISGYPNGSNVFAYSTDGITWTEGIMPSSQNWYSVCYGNGKFVAVAYNSNTFAYSTDGINWTQGTMPSKQRWTSICYGNGKFVTISSTVFAYSTDGINWTEGTMPSANMESVCYGNGKFVAVDYNYDTFEYSTDGINWTQGTMPSSQCWKSVCYGNGKFVATVNNSNVFAYLTVSTSFYQFSGWNKSDFNITADTAVNGSWSQVSAGGGTNLSELSVGDTFFLGKYQVESETPWPIEWEIVHQTADYQIAQTKQIIDLRSFDGKEPTNTDEDRKTFGNNNWKISNIKQFLNSDQASWYSSQHQYDSPPNSSNCYNYSKGTTYNAYDNHKGFLYYFSDEEKNLLQDMTLTLANNTETDGGGSYTWTGKVWLPTYTQMSGKTNNNISEGIQFAKYSDNNSRIKTINKYCAENNDYCKTKNKTEGTASTYWMSSANPIFSYIAWHVGGNGGSDYHQSTYYGSVGLAPCICIPRTGWSDPSKAPDLNYII